MQGQQRESRVKLMPGYVGSGGMWGYSTGRSQPDCATLAKLCSFCLPPLPQESGKRGERGAKAATLGWTQREVMSLSALSSSSLMALYFIFCA